MNCLNKVLLVVDMQKVYEREEWHCLNMSSIEENIKKLCENFNGQIIFTKHVADENAKGTWKNYNEAFKYMEDDQTNFEIVDSLIPYAKTLVTKHTYSCFKSEEFQKLIKTCDDNEIFIVGVETEFCVLGTILDGVDSGFKLTVVTDAITGEKQNLNDAVIEICSRMPAQVSLKTTKDVLTTIKHCGAKSDV